MLSIEDRVRLDFQVEEALVEIENAVLGYHPVVAVYAMFSGGYDSLASTTITARHPQFSGVVHINTGIGIEETREFVRETCSREGWPLIEKMPPVRSYEELVLEFGFPGPGAHGMMYRYLKERAIRDVVYEVIAGSESKGNVILTTGVRTKESTRRMGNVKSVVQRTGAQVWVAPIHSWSGIDTRKFAEYVGMPGNQVSDTLHMSGECLCGSFATSGELEEITLWYPKTAAKIRELEQKAKKAGVENHHWGWGSGKKKTAEDLGPLCSSCELNSVEVEDESDNDN